MNIKSVLIPFLKGCVLVVQLEFTNTAHVGIWWQHTVQIVKTIYGGSKCSITTITKTYTKRHWSSFWSTHNNYNEHTGSIWGNFIIHEDGMIKFRNGPRWHTSSRSFSLKQPKWYESPHQEQLNPSKTFKTIY